MITRSHSKSVVFSRPFLLKGVDRVLPPGDYRVVTDEELIEGISFPVYRRVSTMIFVPSQSRHASLKREHGCRRRQQAQRGATRSSGSGKRRYARHSQPTDKEEISG
jgi:hypothetical protein